MLKFLQYLSEGSEEHAALSDHTKSPYHKIMTKHGFEHKETKHVQNPFAKNNPKADSTEHHYAKGPHHTVILHPHDNSKPHWRHYHKQDNGITAPSHGDTKPQLDKMLHREYGTGA
jgi:hypothetical protein